MLPMIREHQSRAGKLILITVLMTSFSLITVIGRIWIRTRMTRGGLWWDDWMIIVAMVMSIAHGVLITAQVRFGLGQHQYHLPKESEVEWAKTSSHLFYFAQITYFAMFGVIKASIILFILRLASTAHRVLRRLSLLTMAYVVLSTIACVLAGAFQCTPIKFAWDHTIPNGRCINRPAFFLGNAVVNIFSDVVIYVLPMRTLWKVQLPLRQRIGLILVFAVGGFVVLTGIMRLSTLTKVSVSRDLTWDNVPSMWYTEAEFNIAIICACLPSLKPLISSGSRTSRQIAHHAQVRPSLEHINHPIDYEMSENNSSYISGKGSKNSTMDVSRHRLSDVDLTIPPNGYRPNYAQRRGSLTRCQSPSVWLNNNHGYVAKVVPGISSRGDPGSPSCGSFYDPHRSEESVRSEVEAREELEKQGICKTTKITIVSTGDLDGETSEHSNSRRES